MSSTTNTCRWSSDRSRSFTRRAAPPGSPGGPNREIAMKSRMAGMVRQRSRSARKNSVPFRIPISTNSWPACSREICAPSSCTRLWIWVAENTTRPRRGSAGFMGVGSVPYELGARGGHAVLQQQGGHVAAVEQLDVDQGMLLPERPDLAVLVGDEILASGGQLDVHLLQWKKEIGSEALQQIARLVGRQGKGGGLVLPGDSVEVQQPGEFGLDRMGEIGAAIRVAERAQGREA